MEFEVRVIGGIESCYVSLPLQLIQTLQSGYLPPILAIELRSDARLWHVAWCGAASSSVASIEISRQYAECIGLSDRSVVKVRVVSNLPKATLVTIEPLTEDDWEILELNSELAESAILKQVGIVHEEMKFPLWLHGQTVVTFLVMSTFPKKPVVQLVPGTEVAVAPKRRKIPSIPSPEQEPDTKVLLRVQDSGNKCMYNYEKNGVKIDVVFTSGVSIHPETAKNHSFSSLQFVMISPRLLSKKSEKKNPYKNDITEKEAINGNYNDCNQVVVRIVLSDSVAKGHVMLSQSLRLYLGARLHSWVHVKSCNISVKKEIPEVSLSPCHFKMFHYNKITGKNTREFVKTHENHRTKDVSSNSEMGISDWSIHEKIVASLSSTSSHEKNDEEITRNGETNTKIGYSSGICTLLTAWCLAQLDIIVSHGAEDVSSLVIGSKTLLHFKVKDQKLRRNGVSKAEEQSIDVLYVVSFSEDSLNDEDSNAYELAFDKSNKENIFSRCLNMLLEKLKLSDFLSFHADYEELEDSALNAATFSLDWMGTAPDDVYHRLEALLSPNYGMLFSNYNIPFPGHILINGPPGSGKTLLANVSAKSVEECKHILAHVVFVSCSRLSLEKPQTIRQAISSYISEALDHVPSVVVLDNLESIIASSSDSEGSQTTPSSAALVEFFY